jgi:hypothetical protein
MRRFGQREYAVGPDDETLERTITDAIDNEPVFWIGHRTRRIYIDVKVNAGIVTLTGVVRTSEDRRLADIVARAAGAVGVENCLKLADEIETSP